MKILSEYHGEGSERQALVYKEYSVFSVRLTGPNTVRVESYKTEQEAENRAEDWVLGEKNE